MERQRIQRQLEGQRDDRLTNARAVGLFAFPAILFALEALHDNSYAAVAGICGAAALYNCVQVFIRTREISSLVAADTTLAAAGLPSPETNNTTSRAQ